MSCCQSLVHLSFQLQTKLVLVAAEADSVAVSWVEVKASACQSPFNAFLQFVGRQGRFPCGNMLHRSLSFVVGRRSITWNDCRLPVTFNLPVSTVMPACNLCLVNETCRLGKFSVHCCTQCQEDDECLWICCIQKRSLSFFVNFQDNDKCSSCMHDSQDQFTGMAEHTVISSTEQWRGCGHCQCSFAYSLGMSRLSWPVWLIVSPY